MRMRPIAAVIALVALVAACSPAAPDANGGQLEGTDWVLRSYDLGGTLTIVPDTQYVDAEFRSNRVNGFSGCNTYNARYRAGARTLFISKASVTLMACAEESMALEQAYLGLLDSSRFFGIRRNTLTIYSGLGSPILVYDAAPRNPLRGEWQVSAFANGNTVTSLLPGTDIDVAFGIASVGGFSGCNSFSGTYGTNGNVVRVSPLATTRVACDQPIMDQETAFLKALQGSAFIEVRANAVNLTDVGGSILVGLVRPTPELLPGASPGASAPASVEPTEAPPSVAATPAPTPAPTPPPTPTPPPPTAAPTPPPPSGAATPPPTIEPPIVLPTVLTCQLATSDGVAVAAIVYPGNWFTVPEPPELVCRYFSPESITVPADPSTLETDVRASVDATPFADSVAAATDAANWTVRAQQDITVDALPAKVVEATAASDASGYTAGTSRFIYLIDVGSAGTVSLWTTGGVDDAADYQARAGLVTFMVALSVFEPGG
ncbi:MAG TPA: META domain-containing protein [Candidatus Limnocylindrales bacterium]|nr:META domain-containing protein [Candidatus Limnocylindrales bacterium]